MRLLSTIRFVSIVTIIPLAIFGLVKKALSAANSVSTIPPQDCATLGINCGSSASVILNYIWRAINVAMTFTAVIAVAAFIYYGLMYITSHGDESRAKQAKTGIIYSIIGIFIIGFAAIAVNAVINLYFTPVI